MTLADDAERVLDENLLAAAVILRFYEEVDGKYKRVDLLSCLTTSS